jgi:hypothetical protein
MPQEYVEYVLNSSASVVQIELLEIAHPAFSQTYRIVRNVEDGITVTLEGGAVASFDYYPAQIELRSDNDDLDQELSITLGDLGELLPTELDAVAASTQGFAQKPTLIYRTYRSDDLTQPMVGPLRYEISNLAFTRDGCTFAAKAPSLNLNKTGEIYTFERFPMLRAFL